MELPKRLSGLTQAERELLGRFYDAFAKKDFFQRAEIVRNHPETLAPRTLEVHCAYHSSFEHPSLKTFAKENGLALVVVLPEDPDAQAVNRNNPLNREITSKEISTI